MVRRYIPDVNAAAKSVADTAAELWKHDMKCHRYECLMRDGCEERATLFSAHNDAVVAYMAECGTTDERGAVVSD